MCRDGSPASEVATGKRSRCYKVQFRFLHTASQEGVSHVPVKLSKPPAETVSRRWFIVSKRLGSRAAPSSTRCSPATRRGASPPTPSCLKLLRQ